MLPSELLSDSELGTLSDFLDSIDTAMDVERLDGFLCALVAGPDTVLPSEYWPVVLGRDPAESASFATLDQAQQILGLMMKHWNAIATRLHAGEIYYPVHLEDDAGAVAGNAWAIGFLQGVELRREGWRDFFADDDASGAIFSMLALAHENHPDASLRFESPSPEKRRELQAMMVAGLVKIYRYFKIRRRPPRSITTVRTAPQQGRNGRCACGSGKKYKNCCMRTAH
jgi:uncharacterized protein